MANPDQAPVQQVPHRVDSNILVEGEADFKALRNVLLPIDDTDVGPGILVVFVGVCETTAVHVERHGS
jgi:hypothetical protein